MRPAPAPTRHLLRPLLMLAGGISLALGILGIFLPLLPTTPFVLLTAACWARASPRFHSWLLAHRTFGPIVVAWETRRALPRRAKRLGLALMSVSIWSSMWILQHRPWLVLILLATWLVVGVWLWRLPEIPPETTLTDAMQDDGDSA